MANKRLTAREVESAKPEAKRREISDGGSSLYLIVQPSGRKSWAVRYRWRGKPRKLTIGPYPAFSLADARESADEAVRALHNGRDPAREKADEKQREPDLVRKVGADFIEKWHKPRNRTWREVERLLELHVYPSIGGRDIKEVTKRDVLDLLDRAQANGAKVRANRVLAAVRRMFGWAVERGIIDVSPVNGIRAPAPETARDRVLSNDELRAFLHACDSIGDPFAPIVRLLLLTGQRRDEVASAKWVEMDLGDGLWRLPAERTKNSRAHDVPLSTQALAIVEGLPSKGASDLLFPATFSRIKPAAGGRVPRPERPASGFGRAKERLDKAMLAELQRVAAERGEDAEKVRLAPWRLHDLRRTFASGMARLGTPVHVVEKMLNHVSGTFGGIVAVYQRHDFADEKARAMQGWADFLDGLLVERPDNVVQIREAG